MHHNQQYEPAQLQKRNGDTDYYLAHCASPTVREQHEQIQLKMQSLPPEKLNRAYGALFAQHGPVFIEPNFFCQHPHSVSLDAGVFINHNTVLLGERRITIGKGVFIGPNVIVSTRPLDEYTCEEADVIIEDNVWIGANVLILPGTCIRAGAVIGAGNSVTGEVAAHSRLLNAQRYIPGTPNHA